MSAAVSTCVAAALLAGLFTGTPDATTTSDDHVGLSIQTTAVESEAEVREADSPPSVVEVGLAHEGSTEQLTGAELNSDIAETAAASDVPISHVPVVENDEPLETAPPETDPPETIPPTAQPPVTAPPVVPPVEIPELGGAQEPQPPADGTGGRQIIITTPVDIVETPVLLAETAAEPVGGWGAALAAVLASLSIATGAALICSQRRGLRRVLAGAE